MTEEEEKLLKAYYSCFKQSSEGQLVLKDLMNRFFNATSLNEEANANKVLIQEGKRFVTIYILAQVEGFEQWQENRNKTGS